MRITATLLLVLVYGACDDSSTRVDRGPGDGPRVDGMALDGRGPDRRTDAPPAVDKRLGDGGTACTVFPVDNPWNTDISGPSFKVHANSANFIASIGAGTSLHPDFGTVWNGAPNGIPYFLIAANQPPVPVTFDYADESDPGPYPVPLTAPIEGGPSGTGDRHVVGVDLTKCLLYELFSAYPQASSWKAGSGAKFDLRSNKLRTIGWTSADAAGLPIYPGLVRYEEVKAGAINHALRFTVSTSQRAYVLPATHYASSDTNPNRPPMGLRVRLKASFNISTFSKDNQVILAALKKHGMIVADNGGDWYISGAPNPAWSDDDLNKLKAVKGSDFEVVDTGPILTKY